MARDSEQKWRYEFARRIRERLEYLELSQRELSRRTGIPQGTISRYASGSMTPKADVIPKLAKGLILPVSELIDF